MKLEGTKTEKNLKDAFMGESQAHTKYLYYASQAKKDGYEQIAAIFEETARNEKEHAKLWFKELHGGKVPTTIENLKDAANGEHYETNEMYPRMEKEAKEEGFDRIADLFKGVGEIEAHHEKRYLNFLSNIENKIVFEREEDTVWICRNCGNIYIGAIPPETCPVCNHPQSYYEIEAKNY